MAASGLPPLSAVESASFAHLSEAAAYWRRLATRGGRAFTEGRDSMRRPGGTDWEGQAAARAHYRSAVDVVTIGRAVDRLHDAAAIAGRGEDQLEANRRAVLDAVSDARRDGFAVGEDYTVTDRSTGGSRQQRAARLGQAQGHADFIRHRVGALLATDREIATRVSAATQGLDELAFEEVPGVDTPAEDGVQAVDFRQAPPPAAPGGMSSGDIDAIDAANRALLQDMLAEYSRLPDGQVKTDRLADIAGIQEALRVPDSHLIYVAKPDDPADMIPAVTAVGDPFTADHVSVTVPGVSGTTRQTIATMTQEAGDLRREAQYVARKVGESTNVATIAWVGYQPPPVLASWDTVDDDLAQAGAPKLEAFLRDLQAGSHNPGHTTALFGHSYGSLLSGIALKDGASSLVDNAVLYGSPGFDATSPAKLGMNDHNFFVMTTPDDPIRYPARLAPLHGWGSDPNEIIAGSPDRYRFTHLQTDAGSTPLGDHKTAASGHSQYGQDPLQRMTGYNLATILLNRPDLAVRESPQQ